MKIPDPNLRLTLLQALWTAKLAPVFDREAFFRDVLGEEYDFEAPYNDEVHEGVRNALLQIPITEEQLSKLKLIQWDGGDEIHGLIWENWDGEDGTFDVHDFTGIELCRNLEWLAFTAGSQVKDLSPLLGMRSLAKVVLFNRPFEALEPFEKLPALRELAVCYIDGDSSRQSLKRLQQKGVDTSSCLRR
jgi:hypothetical protein